jgi:hypothetical protein
MNRTRITVLVLLLPALALLVAGCQFRIPHLSTVPESGDGPCLACTRRSCIDEANACIINADCRRMLMCVQAGRPLCGPGTPRGMTKILDLQSCWDTHCPAPVCPHNPGAGT